MAEKGQNFFDYGGMPPTPDFVRLRQGPREPQRDQTARHTAEQSAAPSQPKPTEESKKASPGAPKVPPKKSGIDLLRMFNFNRLSMDSDRTLILAVIFLLLGDSSDELLLLALLYIMI